MCQADIEKYILQNCLKNMQNNVDKWGTGWYTQIRCWGSAETTQQLEGNLKRFQKKLLTKSDRYVNINTCHGKQSFPRRKRFQKKLLTNESGYDKISELPLRTTAKQHSSCGARGFDLWQINSNATLKIPRFSEKFKNKQVDRKIDKLPELTVNNAR